jgi:2-polyprenyl-3-methyl-5-hydroxy-6-metoxy-1,4-benzoquinol methylase
MIPCDICGNNTPKVILDSKRLDGPLVQCPQCGLRYIGERRLGLTFGSEAAAEVAERLRSANANLRNLRLQEEQRLAVLNARERLDLIRQFSPSGKLLEVGCARGDFLRVARDYFTAFGVEPNPELAESADVIAPVHKGVIETMPWGHYDIVASFHVIEHVDSPRRFIAAISDQLRSGGLLVLETPDIDSLPFRIMKSRWRQMIPEHYYFFDESTMKQLLEMNGFKVMKIGRIGKFASIGLILNRLSRYFRPFRYAEDFSNWIKLSSVSFEIDPMDIMIAVAVKGDGQTSEAAKQARRA